MTNLHPGPIVRIVPDELHIKDSQFYEEFYARNGRGNKMREESARFGNDTSTFSTPDAKLHAKRRAAMNPFFSHQQILALEGTIRDKLQELIENTKSYTLDGQVLNLQDAWAAFVGDVITRYCFAFDYDHLGSVHFTTNWHKALHSIEQIGHLAVQFPIIPAFMNSLPDALVERLSPLFAQLIAVHRDLRRQIHRLRNGMSTTEKQEDKQSSVINSILQNEDLPASEKKSQRVVDESVLLISAGLLTTAWALSVGSFHIINDESVYKRLREELDAAVPDPTVSDAFKWAELEKLPYLTGCIRESIRLSQPVTHRSQRQYNHAIQYRQWVIPPRTPVGMNLSDICLDENIFPDHAAFKPERWITTEPTKYGQPVDRYFVLFGKGPRSCLGINLAWCELYLGMAAMFRNFRFELYETDITDVQIAHDFWLPSAKLDTKGIRVKVVN